MLILLDGIPNFYFDKTPIIAMKIFIDSLQTNK
jgi:hypothetical protein